MFLLAQAAAPTPFFPPWYFWLFVFSVVVAVLTGFVSLVFVVKRAETEKRVREREIAARLIEVMLTQRKMSPAEIDQVLSSYWRMGTFWYRFQRWLAPGRGSASVDASREKWPA